MREFRCASSVPGALNHRKLLSVEDNPGDIFLTGPRYGPRFCLSRGPRSKRYIKDMSHRYSSELYQYTSSERPFVITHDQIEITLMR